MANKTYTYTKTEHINLRLKLWQQSVKEEPFKRKLNINFRKKYEKFVQEKKIKPAKMLLSEHHA